MYVDVSRDRQNNVHIHMTCLTNVRMSNINLYWSTGTAQQDENLILRKNQRTVRRRICSFIKCRKVPRYEITVLGTQNIADLQFFLKVPKSAEL